ncbi:DEXDc [Aspergillus sclerotialis]|uniref:DNA 3'-5' helicase n=1 Tax=Aspergillus sclerotialis TaxID=2070753 RepID=A0A3A2ZJ94_9EURO|nr:DEXDc [Aspergillus sclerotialis]
MILQAVSLLLQKSITIVLLPLAQIGNEQSEYIRQIGGIPCFLNRDTISPKFLKEVQQRGFTHILISPELAIRDDFRLVASSPSFKQQVSLVVVDEAHLVHHWGRAFRTAYPGSHALLHNTLDPETLKSLKKGISFDPDVKVQQMSIDRPELLFQIGWVPKKAGFKALRFLFAADGKTTESVYQTLSEIPKTIIFFDSRKDAHTAGEDDTVPEDISPQHSICRQKGYSDRFGKGGAQSQIRVIFATEALGMGVDIRDVRRTVQWGVPIGEHAATQLQRGGRASRDKLDGQTPPAIDTTNAELEVGEEGRKPKKLPDRQRRDKLSDFWYNLANSEKKDPPLCIRRQFLDFFNEPNEYRSGRRPNRCCSNCNPQTRLGMLDGFYQYREQGPQANQRTKAVSEALDKWAEEQACLVYKGCAFIPEPTLFLSQDLRDKLAKDAHSVLDVESLRRLVGPWYWSKSHEQALFSIIWTSYRQGNTKTPSTQHSQLQIPSLSSQSTTTVSSFALSMPASTSTPSQNSGRINHWGVGWSPLSTPSSLDMPIQSQNSWSSSISKETVDASPLSLPVALKRSALEEISGNINVKKLYTRNI